MRNYIKTLCDPLSLKQVLVDFPEIFNDIFLNLNNIFLILFSYLKYILALILLLMGLLTLLRYRGIYRFQRLNSETSLKDEDGIKKTLKKSHVIVGVFYLLMGFGVLFNYFTYILYWLLNPLPDMFLLSILNSTGLDTYIHFERIFNAGEIINPYEATIYYMCALISFIALVQIMVSIWAIAKQSGPFGVGMKIYVNLIVGLIGGMFFGFTTCLPFFI